jgi:transcriptional regulator with XRE-family HTH domain
MEGMQALQAPLDVESLRAKLRELSRKEARAIALKADLSPSTIEKFRLGHILEPRIGKLRALADALAANDSRRGRA